VAAIAVMPIERFSKVRLFELTSFIFFQKIDVYLIKTLGASLWLTAFWR
jgi:hypothetical protein